ncbi:hypothetical protein H4Q26_007312 [Puccinia striiformis f. sp. tritici PST-130]|nr:hypothetical protein H4Q26_007312 [Puccinia striiformis f. sp. tritici PST-130]
MLPRLLLGDRNRASEFLSSKSNLDDSNRPLSAVHQRIVEGQHSAVGDEIQVVGGIVASDDIGVEPIQVTAEPARGIEVAHTKRHRNELEESTSTAALCQILRRETAKNTFYWELNPSYQEAIVFQKAGDVSKPVNFKDSKLQPTSKDLSLSWESVDAVMANTTQAQRPSNQELVNTIRGLGDEIRTIASKASQLERDSEEHSVVETLKKTDPARKCFRMIEYGDAGLPEK